MIDEKKGSTAGANGGGNARAERTTKGELSAARSLHTVPKAYQVRRTKVGSRRLRLEGVNERGKR